MQVAGDRMQRGVIEKAIGILSRVQRFNEGIWGISIFTHGSVYHAPSFFSVEKACADCVITHLLQGVQRSLCWLAVTSVSYFWGDHIDRTNATFILVGGLQCDIATLRACLRR